MSAAPFDVTPVIERLQARVVSADGMRLVGSGADYAQVRALADFPTPCCYVLLAFERGIKTRSGMSEPGMQHPIAQQMLVGLGIVMAFRNYRGLQGTELRDELRVQVGAVRNQLLGWTPPVSGGVQMQLESGDLEDYDASVALWADRWTTQHFIQPEIAA